MKDLHEDLAGTAEGLGAKAVAVGGTADHVHLLVEIRATQAVADLVREIKKAGSAWGAERYRHFGWQSGYAAIAVSPGDVPRIRSYIGRQEEHHLTVSAVDELRALLAESGVTVDEKFFE